MNRFPQDTFPQDTFAEVTMPAPDGLFLQVGDRQFKSRQVCSICKGAMKEGSLWTMEVKAEEIREGHSACLQGNNNGWSAIVQGDLPSGREPAWQILERQQKV